MLLKRGRIRDLRDVSPDSPLNARPDQCEDVQIAVLMLHQALLVSRVVGEFGCALHIETSSSLFVSSAFNHLLAYLSSFLCLTVALEVAQVTFIYHSFIC